MPKRRTSGLPSEIQGSDDHAFAITCIHCTDTCDSFKQYVSTYCHLHHEHLAWFNDSNIARCRECLDYVPRPGTDKDEERRK